MAACFGPPYGKEKIMENNKSQVAFLLEFDRLFGDVEWQDKVYVQSMLMDLVEIVSLDEEYQKTMAESSEGEARRACEKAVERAMLNNTLDMMELYKQFKMNPKFRECLIRNVEEESRLKHMSVGDEFIPYETNKERIA